MGLLYETLYLLRTKYHFNGYIHVKGIPGASADLLELTGYLADRMSVNLELPTADALRQIAPNKCVKTSFPRCASYRMEFGKAASFTGYRV